MFIFNTLLYNNSIELKNIKLGYLNKPNQKRNCPDPE